VNLRQLELPEVWEITPKKLGDSRGFFSETFSERIMIEKGFPGHWVQDNFSKSQTQFTLRGLHFQIPPMAQDKLVRVVRGSIFDVAVDIRRGSPRYGQWTGVILSESSWNQLLVPKGFAHGFLTLEPDTEVAYKVTNYYSPECDRGIAWNDPTINIAWPLSGHQPSLSEKDANARLLADVDTGFDFNKATP
jgi:dTDP-4-dehydrorhamnose 3,5-epimerase